MSAYAQHDDSFFSRRSVAVIFIIGLHAVLIYAFATGLAAGAIRVVPEVLAGRFIDPPRTPSSPPPLPPPGFTQPRVVIPEDPLVIEAPRDPGATMQNLAPTVGDTVPPPSPPAEMIKRVLGGPGKGFPNTDDYYPSDAKRMGKRGIATVQVCVDVRGILTADPVLAQTSGSAILDGGALRLARAGSGHYRPTTEDGQPVSSCYSYRIRYDLRD